MSQKPNKLHGPFSAHYNDVDDSPAFKAMRPLAQLLFLKSKRFYNRQTEAPIFMSVRRVLKLVGITDKNTARSLREEIVHHGFWREISPGYLGSKGKGVAATYRLTDERFKGRSATLDFQRWNGVPYWSPKTKPCTAHQYRPVLLTSTLPYCSPVQGKRKARKKGISDTRPPVLLTSTHLEEDSSHLTEGAASSGAGAKPDADALVAGLRRDGRGYRRRPRGGKP
jgi:hypothetical protein